MNSIERTYQLSNAKSRADLARFLAVTSSAIQGYEKRGYLPLEQCIKVAEQTGVSLDWLIAGKGEMYPENYSADLTADVQMLLTGWKQLNTTGKGKILQAVLAELEQQT